MLIIYCSIYLVHGMNFYVACVKKLTERDTVNIIFSGGGGGGVLIFTILHVLLFPS